MRGMIYKMKKDILIVGAGPAGIFTALEMLRRGRKEKILIVEKGKAIENRSCPKSKLKTCANCKPYCHIPQVFLEPERFPTASFH